jgi:hypothetical protein
MQKPERSAFAALDFVDWHENGSLILTPKFQRRGVWKTPARSHLIDTLIRGMPVPPIYLRIRQSDDKKKIVREVIDGQQRISAILDFVADKFALSKNLGVTYGARRFSELTQSHQDSIRQYSFTCESFSSISDREVLEIFSRLNTYSVPLTAQELRNGKYFGPFKRSIYNLATSHLEFWRENRIFTELSIARMAEAELTSELIVVQIDGFQDKKKSLDSFYEQYDEKFKDRQKHETRFQSVIDVMTSGITEILKESEFRRVPLFYSLYSAIYHRLYGIPNEEARTNRKGRMSTTEIQHLRDVILTLSEKLVLAKNEEKIPHSYGRFVGACLGQTDNIKPRQVRFGEIYGRAFL